MNTDQLRARMRGGFKPFVLHLSNGRKFKIGHPHSILVGKWTLAVLGPDDLVETLDPLHIVSVEDMKSKPRKTRI